MTDRNVFTNEVPSTEPMSFAEAKNLLGLCKRLENRDHYFSDREVFWVRGDVEVAEGYFGGGDASVYIHEEFGGRSFHGQEALDLSKVASIVEIGRNDETGPDEYGGL